MPLLVLLLIFIAVPLAELYAIFKVGEAIGYPLTITVLAVDSIVGAVLLKSQGRSAWRRFTDTMAAGRMPHREVLDGVLVIFGGAFLITPGFLTDLAGLLLLIPPTRTLARRLLVRAVGGRFAVTVTAAAARRRRSAEDFDVEGSATEVNEDPFEPPVRRLPR